MKKFLNIVYEESRFAFQQWTTRNDVSLGYYIVGTIMLAPIVPCLVAVNVVRRMMPPS